MLFCTFVCITARYNISVYMTICLTMLLLLLLLHMFNCCFYRCQLRLFSVIVDPDDNPSQVERDVREYLEQVRMSNLFILFCSTSMKPVAVLIRSSSAVITAVQQTYRIHTYYMIRHNIDACHCSYYFW